MKNPSPKFFLIMGVSGSGKSVVGRLLAQKLGWDFFDADDFHPPANIAKMASGLPLDDVDRIPWLGSLRGLVSFCLESNRPGILSCSALKESYRRYLIADNPAVRVIYLKGGFDLILSRMAARAEHFMKPKMLESQFDALEEPVDALIINIELSIDEIVEKIIAHE